MRSDVIQRVKLHPKPGTPLAEQCAQLAESRAPDGGYILTLDACWQIGIRRRKQQPVRGLGDVVWWLCHHTGIDRLAFLWSKHTGRPCGCGRRRQKLNRWRLPRWLLLSAR